MTIDMGDIPGASRFGMILTHNPQDGYALEELVTGGDNIYDVTFVLMPTKVVTFDKRIVSESREGAVLLAAAEYSMTLEEAVTTRVIVKFVSHL